MATPVATTSQGRRRESIVPRGIDEECEAALKVHDSTFFGDDLAMSLSSDSETESDEESSPKRLDLGEVSQSSSSSDSDEELHVDPLNESYVNFDDIDIGDAEEGLLAAEIRDWQEDGCGCKHSNCFAKLDAEKLLPMVKSFKRIPKKSKRLFVLGQLTAALRETSSRAKKREYSFTHTVLGVTVCKRVFMDLNGIGQHVYGKLQDIAEAASADLPSHKSKGNQPSNVMHPSVVENAVAYVRNIANIVGLPQPAAPRGRAKLAPIYLPASHRKRNVYDSYVESLDTAEQPISYRSFCRLWQVHASDVVVMKPRTDVCAICERHRESIKRARTEEEFAEANQRLAMHLETARDERAYYNDMISTAREDNTLCHLTFDFAQQLELPAQSRQVGPLYFKVRFRVQLFGICEEAKKHQTNFVFDEAQSIGPDGSKAHGPNAVISMFDHHLKTECSEQRNLSLHADNCVGQNKNKSVLGYLMWRVLCGMSDTIELNFMRVGHTRCSVDAYFGLLKQKIRSSDINTVQQACEAIDKSCKANSSSNYEWEWREWDAFLAQYFQPVKGIRSFQHFRMCSESPGTLFARVECYGEEKEFQLLKPNIELASIPKDPPPVVPAAGISAKRLQYLDKEIAQFIPDDCQVPWKPAEE